MLKSLQLCRAVRCLGPLAAQRWQPLSSAHAEKKAATRAPHDNFDDILKKRSAQASRSIAVEVESDHLYNAAYHHCKQFGAIQNAFAYTLKDSRRFMLLEYEDEQAVAAVYGKASFKSNAVPWPNRFVRLQSAHLASDQYQSADTPVQYSTIDEPSIEQRLQKAKSLDEQIRRLYELTAPTEVSARLRFLRAHQIESNTRQRLGFLLPRAEIVPFGSLVNGFGTMNSKLYLSMQSNGGPLDGGKGGDPSGALEFYGKDVESQDEHQLTGAGRQIKCIASALEYYLPNCADFMAYPKSKIPFFTFHDSDTQCKVEVCMDNHYSIKTTEVMYVLGMLDARVRPFICLIQRWVHEHSLSPLGKDKLSTTHVIYMALAFLQQLPEPVLPTIDQIYGQLSADHTDRLSQPIDLAQLEFQSTNKSSVAELFKAFLIYYLNFSFDKKLITLRTTEQMPRIDAVDKSTICLQNLFATDDNLSENVDMDQLHAFLTAVQNALNAMPHWQVAFPDGDRWGLLKLFKHLK